MEAKDTVLKRKCLNKETQKYQDRLLLEQAEISFKAGQENILQYLKKTKPEEVNEAVKQIKAGARHAGRKEVVERINVFLKNTPHDSVFIGRFKIFWQAELKKWGIDGSNY